MRAATVTCAAILCCLWALCLAPCAAWGQAKHLGTFGRTYGIAEPDMLEEIRARAAQIDWQKHLDAEKMKEKVKSFQPDNLQRLPKATRTRSFMTDPTYVLDMDIPDPRDPSGQTILYPKGFSFNPLDYRPLSSILVIFDATDPDQLAWFESTPYRDDFRAKVLLSDGNYFEVMERLDRPVFYLIAPHAERLQLQAVPSVIVQRDRALEVTEILVERQGEGQP
ncbi:hypothetical protein [Geoalkalibacter halelectricus]|uniref:hypothetical protein n=1 Tax=Geoalkalibacter halelectricus TaxID=2847045 RepID=UPI003D23472C